MKLKKIISLTAIVLFMEPRHKVSEWFSLFKLKYVLGAAFKA